VDCLFLVTVGFNKGLCGKDSWLIAESRTFVNQL
jgi:hypothetical protein